MGDWKRVSVANWGRGPTTDRINALGSPLLLQRLTWDACAQMIAQSVLNLCPVYVVNVWQTAMATAPDVRWTLMFC